MPKIDPDQLNQAYFDLEIRHQIGVRRFTAGEVKRLLRLMEKADRSLATELRKRLRDMPRGVQTTKRLQEMLRAVREQRNQLIRELRGQFTPEMRDFSVNERDVELRTLGAVQPANVGLTAPTAGTMRAIVTRNLFDGRLLDDWFKSLQLSDRSRLTQQLQLGLAQGESTGAIVRRIVGTKAEGFTNGVLATSRRNAEVIVRTVVNGVSNAAREEVWNANEDIIQALQWSFGS